MLNDRGVRPFVKSLGTVLRGLFRLAFISLRSMDRATLFVLTSSLFLITCKKEISFPNSDLEKLFGTWQWVETYCGWSGQSTPSSTGHNQTVEFDKKGICKIYEYGKLQEKRKYSITEGSSIFTTGTAYLIKYESKELFHKKKDYSTQSIWFGGQDSLFLNQEAYDGCNNSYIRK